MKKILVVLMLIFSFGLFSNNVMAYTVRDGFEVGVVDGLKVFYGEDVVFDYVAINGDLVNINGSIYETVLDGDFVIGEDTITISSRYLYSILDRRPDISMTVFSWVFNSDDGLNTVVGYLFIDLQTGKDSYTKQIPEVNLISVNMDDSNNINEVDNVHINLFSNLINSLNDLFHRVVKVFKVNFKMIRN